MSLVLIPEPRPPRRLSDREISNSLLLQMSKRRTTMKSQLNELFTGFSGWKCASRMDIPVSGLATDSRRVIPGTVFCVIEGMRTSGSHYIEEALERGAVAIVGEKGEWVPPRIPFVEVEDARLAVAHLAHALNRFPAKQLQFTGILGTGGKTVVAHLLRELAPREERPGLLGSIENVVGARTLPATRTTPEPVDLANLLSQMTAEGVKECLLEVSGHGIDQKRIHGIAFEELQFLNLTPEHLDYYGDLESAFQLHKAFILNQNASVQRLLIGLNDSMGSRMAAELSSMAGERLVTFGCDCKADFRAEEIHCNRAGTRFRLVHAEGSQWVESRLIGNFNVDNLLCALASVWLRKGLSGLEMAIERLREIPPIRGRMERLSTSLPFEVIIDYMHTEASYQKGLQMLGELTRGRLLTVFGCGGNRDPRRRPRIARVVARSGSMAIVTADNPRHERVESIFQDIAEGFTPADDVHWIPDRREAVRFALSRARPGDCLVIAGKGHEMYQDFGDCVVPHDDRAVVREWVNEQEGKKNWP